jgi:hypothetical protein
VLGPDALRHVNIGPQQNLGTENLRWVNNTDHASLAMLRTCAVKPDRRRRVLNSVHESLRRSLGGVVRGNVARPKSVVKGLAGLSERTLGDGVGLRPELEGDGVALGSSSGVGHERKTVLAHNDNVVSRHGGASNSGSSEDGGETHVDWCRGFCGRETSSFRCER